MLRGRAAPRWLWITPVPDDDIIRKKNLTFNRAGIECTLSDHVFCLDNGEGLNYHKIPSRKSSFSWILKQFIFAFFLKKSNIKPESRKNQVGILIVVLNKVL